MNFPYSRKKWLSVSLAALLLATGSTGAFADTTTPQAPAAAQATDSVNKIAKLTEQTAIEQALKTNADLVSFRLDVHTADVNARLVHAKVKDIPDSFIESLDAAQSKYVNDAKVQMAKKVNELALKALESKIKLGAQSAYYDLLNAQADLSLKKQSLKRAETQLKVAKAKFEVGEKAKTEVLQAQAALAGAQAALAASESNLQIKRLKLNEFLGVELQTQWEIASDVKSLQAKSMKLEDAVEQAIKTRYEIKQKEEEIKVAELNLSLYEKYSMKATYQGMMGANELEKAKLALEEEKRAIAVEVSKAYYDLQAALAGIEALQKGKEASAENYRLVNLKFENGLATTLEVIQAEVDLSDSENKYQDAVLKVNLAIVNFENALGN